MAPDQRSIANPYGMDESCTNCSELPSTREHVVHGYGDVGADFVFVLHSPSLESDRDGSAACEISYSSTFERILADIGLLTVDDDDDRPGLENAYVTYLVRCRHPERDPTTTELSTCEPYLNAEIRTINPEVLIPVGSVSFQEIADEYTTLDVADRTIDSVHGHELRGRGFAIVPMLDPSEQTKAQTEAWVTSFSDILGRDYRQTKGRQKR